MPKGPSTATIAGGSTRATSLSRFVGSMTVRLTPGGRDTGAAPIRDAHCGDWENDRGFAAEMNAGIRKSGSMEGRFRVILG